jgi:hypothetical protein
MKYILCLTLLKAYISILRRFKTKNFKYENLLLLQSNQVDEVNIH